MAERKGIYASTAWMLAAVVIFYALIAITQSSITRTELYKDVAKEGALTLEQLKEKEVIFQKNLESRPGLMTTVWAIAMLVLFAGLGTDLWLFLKARRRSPWIGGGVPLGPAPWGIRDVFHVVVFLLFAEVCLLIVELCIYSFFHLGRPSPDLFLMLNSLIRDILAAGMVIYIVRVKFSQDLSEIGLTRHQFLGNVRRGLLAYLSVIPILILAMFALSAVLELFHYEPPPQNVVQLYLKTSTEPYLLLFTVFVAVLGPMIEEIFFRGFAYKAMRTRWGVRAGTLITAGIFAGFHMSLVTFVPIFILGVFLSYLYEETGSLVPSMTAHITHNLIMVLLTLGFKGLSV